MSTLSKNASHGVGEEEAFTDLTELMARHSVTQPDTADSEQKEQNQAARVGDGEPAPKSDGEATVCPSSLCQVATEKSPGSTTLPIALDRALSELPDTVHHYLMQAKEHFNSLWNDSNAPPANGELDRSVAFDKVLEQMNDESKVTVRLAYTLQEVTDRDNPYRVDMQVVASWSLKDPKWSFTIENQEGFGGIFSTRRTAG